MTSFDNILFWLVYWGFVGFIVLVWWKGDIERHPDEAVTPWSLLGILDRVKRLMMVDAFNAIKWCVGLVAPQAAARLTTFEDYFFNKPNRLFAFLYWLLFMSGYAVFVMHGFEHIPGRFVTEGHKLWGSLWVFCSWAQYIHIMYSNPGKLTSESYESKLDEWEYDDLFYEPKWCNTCQLQRPARSKHCKVCNMCVARFDHHCIWINSCVGQSNQLPFILFLLNHFMVMVYISMVGLAILYGAVLDLDLFNAYYFDEQGRQTAASYGMIFHYVLRHFAAVFGISLFTGLLSTLFMGFLGFQTYLITLNVTTNEWFKWGDIKSWAIAEGRPEWIPKQSPFHVGVLQNWLQVVFPSRLHCPEVERLEPPKSKDGAKGKQGAAKEAAVTKEAKTKKRK